MRRLKIELDVYSKTFVELRKKLVEAEDKQKLAEAAQASLEAKIAGLQSEAVERTAQVSKEVQTTAVDLEESAREQDFQQKVERIRQELRIQWDLDHKVKIK